MSTSRVVMIGWDGADRATIDTWLRDGALPNLAALRARGTWTEVASLPGLGDDACWSSFSTGVGPATHGRFHYRQIVPGTYRERYFFRDRMSQAPFWRQIGDAGRRVAVFDVPKSPLAIGLNGIEIADWLPHGEDGPVPVSCPPELADAVPERFRPSPGFNCHRVLGTVHALGEHCDRIREHVELRTGFVLDWLRREPWDLFLAVFAESHCIGHHAWHLHDAGHPQHTSEAASVLGDPMRDVHARLDAALGRILAECHHDTTVIVFSLLGMGPNHIGTWLAGPVLRRLEAARGGTPRFASGSLRAGRAPMSRWPGVPSIVRRALRRHERARREAFVVHSDASSTAIRLNLAGREPRGRICAADYDAECLRLADAFLALSDPDDGRALVTEVVRVTERYPGPHSAAYADLLVVWNSAAPIRAAASDATGIIRGIRPDDRSGNHRPGGWFLAAGPGIAPGRLDHPARIVDLAPTVGALLGVELCGMEGAPLRTAPTATSSNPLCRPRA